MFRAGLTGGLGSGKSLVGAALAELGCHLIRADDLGHQVLLPGGEAYDDVVREFGRGFLNEDGTINRRLLAAEVFGKPDRLEVLSSFVHPSVILREEKLMAEIAEGDADAIAVVEAAILIETGSYKRFDRLIVVVCQEEQQVERAMQRDGITREEASLRLRRQMPLVEKRRFADYVIDNSGDVERTLGQTREVYESLRRLSS